MVNFKLHLYFPGGGVAGWGGVIIKIKANLSSTGSGLPTGTELGNKVFYPQFSKYKQIMYFFHALTTILPVLSPENSPIKA